MIDFDARDYQRQLDELARAYRELPRALNRKYLKAAMRRAVNDTGLLPRFRAVAPKGETGALRKSPKIVVGFLRSGAGKGQVYGRVGYGRPKGNAAALVNDGTKERFTKAGKRTGRIVGTRFASPALSAARSTGPVALEKRLTEALEAAKRELPVYLARRRR